MKQLILTLLLVCPFLMLAQTSGEITFKEVLKIQVDLPEGMEEFKDMIPTSQNFQRVLLFDEKATVYKDVPVDESENEDINMASDGGQVQMRMEFSRPDNQMYCDVGSGTTVEKRDFMDKKFLINGKSKRYKWKMTGEQKNILDYACQKAVFKDTARTVVAWFTTQIPVSAGPATYSGLPGMILEMDIDEGERTIQATKVELKKLEKNAISAPRKGKKVTEEEFDKIVEEKTKELQEQYGGNGNVIIQRRGGN